MRLIAGWELDGGAWPDVAGSRQAVVGEAVVGPLGLLAILETHLGLGRRVEQPPVRIATYQRRLERALADTPRFYGRSLAADGWQTAHRLLELRDELVESGWDGLAPDGAPSRIADLAAVEAVADPELPPGPADRFRAVAMVLREGWVLPIERITLVDGRTSWPPAWRSLLYRLEHLGVVIEEEAIEAQGTGGDLALLQRRLVGDGREGRVAGDETLLLLEPETESDAAELLASWLAADPDANGDVVIIRGEGSEILDEALGRVGLPRLGVYRRSRWRAVLQVLPLAIATSWNPPSPYRILELLMLPKGPIPFHARMAFERALRETPGVGGESWAKARERAHEMLRESAREQADDEPAIARREKELDEAIDFWLERERFDPSEGMPVAAIEAICDRVTRWAARQSDEDELFDTVANHAKLLGETVRTSGKQVITRVQLERMLDAIVGGGKADLSREAEAAPWGQIASPGQLRSNARVVIWWDCVDAASLGHSATWTPVERTWLAANGVALDSRREQRLRVARSWHRPLMGATERLILISPRMTAGSPCGHHPIWDEICAAVAPKHADQLRITRQTSADLRSGELLELAGRTLRRDRSTRQSPPRGSGEFRLPAGAIGRPEKISPSSIEALVACPLAWTFSHAAGIRAGAMAGRPHDSLIYGRLAHAIVERLFAERSAWDPDDARQRVDELFPGMLETHAATLLEPGREVERADLHTGLRIGIPQLMRTVLASNLTFIAVEEQREERLADGVLLNGRLDLLFEDAEGRRVVIDMKWTRRNRHYRELLENGRSVQLAAYAHLVREQSKGVATAGYFILNDGQLHAPRASGLDGAMLEAPTLDAVWHEVESIRESRLREIERGEIVAASLGDESDPFSGEIDCTYCEHKHLCGVARVKEKNRK